jgi:sigma-B regulation protein RsbU (phosphoserine phosphatase)
VKTIPNPEPLSILLVDDDWYSRIILGEIFNTQNIRMVATENGLEALELARTFQPTAILLDIHLPDLDGFEVCRRLKDDSQTRDIPILFLTARSQPQDIIRGLSEGGVDYITKPFLKEELLARIRVQARLKAAYETIIALQNDKLETLKAAYQAFNKPVDAAVDPGCRVFYHTAQEAGSDQCDVVAAGPGAFGYFLADVEGHGIESSYLASSLRVLFRENSALLATPPDLLDRMNVVLRDFLSEGRHVTGVYAYLDRTRGLLSLASAGHLPVLVQGAGGEVETLETESDVLGVFPEPRWGLAQRTLAPGDRVWFYTDGVIEDPARFGTWLDGLEALRAAVRSTRALDLDGALERVCGALDLPVRDRDDSLILVVEA